MTLSAFDLSRRAGLALALAAALGAAAPMLSAPAFAADVTAAKATIEAAKAAGDVGEQGDGYLGLVDAGASPAIRAAVAEINQGRAEVYKETAAKTGVTPEAAGQATARQLVARVPGGQYYKPLDGAWAKK